MSKKTIKCSRETFAICVDDVLSFVIQSKKLKVVTIGESETSFFTVQTRFGNDFSSHFRIASFVQCLKQINCGKHLTIHRTQFISQSQCKK